MLGLRRLEHGCRSSLLADCEPCLSTIPVVEVVIIHHDRIYIVANAASARPSTLYNLESCNITSKRTRL